MVELSDIEYDINGKVPKLSIKGVPMGVCSMTRHYVTNSNILGTNVITFIYIDKNNPVKKILSIKCDSQEIFLQ
ncbi:hypothetical protein ACFFIF_01915 [Vagococcus entomophilus]|uniref:Uncharacterized protein n=1 Tax=Vagococcus entomophilus TaxID=1160095 RepID=A0A430AJZ1_9ENTE|nr:hypothetical protein [Vagococcus entomophilus]RSU08442.1 hypothetical protein CBF30_04165 [Vagococcus entomophilus]